MHPSVMTFVGKAVTTYGLQGKSVLEIGSMDVNGSARPLFEASHYLGTDMRPGPGVDLVVNAHALVALPTMAVGEWDVIVCCEMLEHDDEPWLTLQQAHEMAIEDGYLILTARGFDERGAFQLHGYPEDYWRFSVTGMTKLLVHTGWIPVYVGRDPTDPGVFAVATKVAV